MARIRSIKPEFWTDGKVRRLSDTTALFFIALWNHCDDDGYFPTDSLELSMKVARWRSQDVKRLLSALHGAGMIRLSQGHGVGMVVSWHHQKIDKKRPSKWKDIEIQWDTGDDSSNGSEQSTTARRKDRIGEDRIGEDRISSTTAQAHDVAVDEEATKEKTKTAPTWKAYSEAYSRRYGVDPVRNATINAQLKNFVKRIGEEEAPLVAGFYVCHNDQFYVRQMHPVGMLLKDAEKLRTEWKTNRRMSNGQARAADRKQTNANAFGTLLREAEEREARNA